MHTKTVVQMAVTLSAITETEEFKKLAASAGRENAITMALSILGMDLNTLSSNYGLVRTIDNRETLFFDWIYTGLTRADFPYKNMYDTVDIIAPRNIPKDAKIYSLNELNYEDSVLKALFKDLGKVVPARKRVKTPKFKPDNEE